MATEKLTAEQARSLAGIPEDGVAEQAVERLLVTIKKLAEEKKRKCATSYQHKEDVDLWVYQGYKGSPTYKLAVEQLEALGFKVTFFYEERQFVNMYTLVEW